MHRGGMLAVAGVLALLVVGATAATASGHYTGLDENDVSNEPSQPTDHAVLDTPSGIPGNGFSDEAQNRWDLVLDGYAVSDDYHPVDPNSVLAEALEGFGMEHEPLLYPGTVDYNAWWGWWKDKGSGAWAQEMGDEGAALAGGPDEKIDDGDDDHSSDVHYSNAADLCPTDDPTCWQETGTWDEWILRGGGLSEWAGNQEAEPTDPSISSYNDQMKLFIDPGTTARILDVATGHPEEQRGPSRPGYAVLTDADDRWNVPDANCEHGGYEDDRGDKSSGAAWQCIAGVTTDRSVLITTRVRTAVNAPLADDATKARATSDALAVDTDTYSTPHPMINELYRTAVWDPGDETPTPLVEDTEAYPNEGVKEVVLETYTHTFPQVYDSVTDVVGQAVEPTEPFRGIVRDRTIDPPWPHEPNHPDDSYPAATRGVNPADYNGNFGRDEDGDGQTTYYEPNDQSWEDYQKGEHLWADFFQFYTPLPNILLGGGFGFNVADPLSPDEQNTHIPGFLVPYARAGTWADTSEDTWIGNADPVDAYQQGTVDDPNAYGSDELRFVCSGEGSLSATFYPGVPPRADVSGPNGNPDGEKDVYDRPWGTTTPPKGVYHWNSFGGTAGGLVQDIQDGQLDRHVQYGPIDIGMGCSGRSTGTWFPGDAILMPSGSTEYPIVMEGSAELKDQGTDRTDRLNPGQTIGAEKITDVDVVNSWT